MNDTLADAVNGTLPLWRAALNSAPPENQTALPPGEDAYDVGTGVKVGSTILLVVLICGGTFGNCLIIGAVYATPSLRTVSNIFIVNLAVADLMVSSVVDTFNIVGILDQSFLVDHPLVCELVGVVCVTSCICSLVSVTNVGINRSVGWRSGRAFDYEAERPEFDSGSYPGHVWTCARRCAPVKGTNFLTPPSLLFVVKPDWHASVYTVPKTLVIVAASWVYSFLFDLPLLLGWGKHSYDIKTMGCTYDRTDTFSYTLFLVIAGIGLPLVVVVCSYSKIFYHVHQSKMRVAVHLANPKGNMNNNVNYEEIRLIKTLLVVCVVFYLCWLPHAVVALADFDDHWPQHRRQVAAATLKMHTDTCPAGLKTMLPKPTSSTGRTFIHTGVQIWNQLPDTIVGNINGLQSFKSVHFLATVAAHGSSSINCLVYGFMNKKFKSAFRKLLGMKPLPSHASSKKKDTLPLPPIREDPGAIPSFSQQRSANDSSRL
ncbi:melatonin receptor [Branchiostoma belcheri]|nr:melatonin receptor [Branchiostoma belcheri]